MIDSNLRIFQDKPGVTFFPRVFNDFQREYELGTTIKTTTACPDTCPMHTLN